MALKPPQPPTFLARRSYRQRRLRDAVRVLPIIGGIFWLLPVIYVVPPTSTTGLYLFGVWMVLIILSGLIAALMRDDAADDGVGSVVDDEGTRS